MSDGTEVAITEGSRAEDVVVSDNNDVVTSDTPSVEEPKVGESVVEDDSSSNTVDEPAKSEESGSSDVVEPAPEPTPEPTPVEPEPTPEPVPEPIPTPEPSEGANSSAYIPVINPWFGKDFTEKLKWTWDGMIPTSNKYIYYRSSDGVGYDYCIFNESVDTIYVHTYCSTNNSDVIVPNLVEAYSKKLPYINY